MDAKALAALKASIKHWEENVAAEKPEDAHVGAIYCALCDLFNNPPEYCVGCPVWSHTDEGLCGGTPYILAVIALNAWRREGGIGLEWRKAAQAELDFLRSLLPEGEQ